MAVAMQTPPAGDPLAEHPIVRQAKARFAREKARWDLWVPLWQEAYDYSLPQRDRFYQQGFTEGDKRTFELYDMTAPVSVHEFASRLHAGIMPPFTRWADFVPGTDVPKGQESQVKKALEEACAVVFEVLQHSNLDSQIHEAFLDLSVGTASLLVEEGIDKPIHFLAVPATHCILGSGPNGIVDANFRIEPIDADQIRLRWPGAVQRSEALANRLANAGTASNRFEVIHATWRDWSQRGTETYAYVCWLSETGDILDLSQYQGEASNPWISFRWNKAAGETYGRGPLLNAMPAVKTANLVMRDMLDAAEMATVGMYQAEDDGVINTSAIRIEPGTIVPVAPGSKGLTAIGTASDIRWGEFMLEQMRADIKKALYDEMLGPPEGTPMSATEVRERQADMARRIGSPFMRLQVECVQPLLKRVIAILRKQGAIQIPQVNGRLVKINAISPLARAQQQDDVRNIFSWLEMLMQHYGPEMMQGISKPVEVARLSGLKLGVPENVIASPEEYAAWVKAQQQAQGLA